MFNSGTYYIVSVYKAEGFCVDLPTETYQSATGDLQKYWPNGSRNQQWNIHADPASVDSFLVKWQHADKYMVEGAANRVKFQATRPDADGSWSISPAGDGSFVLTCRGSGLVLDYWSTDDRERGPLYTKKFQNGARQQRWYLQPVG